MWSLAIFGVTKKKSISTMAFNEKIGKRRLI